MVVCSLSILLFTDNPVVTETRLVLEELRERRLTPDYKAPWDVSFPFRKPMSYDLVYVPANMLHRGSTFELLHRYLILRELKRDSIMVNPLESMLIYSKEHLTIKMENAGIPHPKTLITENVERAYRFAKSILDDDKEVVLKPICKARGIGVTKLSRIRSREDLMQFLVWYDRQHGEGVFYLQEFIPNHGYDVRCLVINGRVIGREKRFNPEDFRYNVSAGGMADKFEDPIYDELAIEVAEAVGLKIAGIDILPGLDDEPKVLEANCFPGYKALMETTGIPVHKHIVDYLESLLK